MHFETLQKHSLQVLTSKCLFFPELLEISLLSNSLVGLFCKLILFCKKCSRYLDIGFQDHLTNVIYKHLYHCVAHYFLSIYPYIYISFCCVLFCHSIFQSTSVILLVLF